jgi:hypothetical protein
LAIDEMINLLFLPCLVEAGKKKGQKRTFKTLCPAKTKKAEPLLALPLSIGIRF